MVAWSWSISSSSVAHRWTRAVGADVGVRTRKGDTALHAAARAGFCELARVLLGASVDVNARNAAGRTPLHEARERERHDMVVLLRSSGGVI